MKLLSLDSVDAIYDCARLAEMEVHNVDHAEFHSFCLSLKAFERSLGEMARDDYWRPFLRSLKRYRFDISSTPLPFKYAMGQNSDLAELLRRQLAHCHSIYPQFADQAFELIDRVLALQDSPPNPTLKASVDISECSEGDLAILIKEPRLVPPVEQFLREELSIGTMEVISTSQLKGHFCYSNLVVIGPARWYEDYVFQSPRARRIHLVKYRWITDVFPSREVFTGSQKHSIPGSVDFGDVVSTSSSGRPVSSGDSLTPEDFLPSIDWDDVLRIMSTRAVGPSGHMDGDEEYATARLFQLEGEIVVPLDSAEGSIATVLDLSEEEANPVRRIPVTNIEPGMFLLMRKGGGGEYIISVADRILGELADRARELQRGWKNHLRRKVREDGLLQVIRELKRHGSRRANQANVRNWQSYRSIKTEDHRDFRAVMELTGLADSFDDYWKTMTLIDSAHRKAGQFIRRQLLAQVRMADFHVLEKLGQMDFDLHRDAGVNLTAIRVKSIHPQIIEIDVARLGRPFEMDGNVWLG